MEPCHMCGEPTTVSDRERLYLAKADAQQSGEHLALHCRSCHEALEDTDLPSLLIVVPNEVAEQGREYGGTMDSDDTAFMLHGIDPATGLRHVALHIAQSVAAVHGIQGDVLFEEGLPLAEAISNLLNELDPPCESMAIELGEHATPSDGAPDTPLQVRLTAHYDPREWVATAAGWHDTCWEPAKKIFERRGQGLTEAGLGKVLELLAFVLDPWPEHLNRSMTWTESVVFASLACGALHQGADTAAVRQVIEETEPHDIDLADRCMFGEELASILNTSGKLGVGRAVEAGVDVDLLAASQAWEAKAKSHELIVDATPRPGLSNTILANWRRPNMDPGFREKLYALDLQSQATLVEEALKHDYSAAVARGQVDFQGDPTLWKLNALVCLRLACVFEGPAVEELLKRACLGMHHLIAGGVLPSGTNSMCSCYEILGELLAVQRTDKELIEQCFTLSSRPESKEYLRVFRQYGMEALRESVVESTLAQIRVFSSGPSPGSSW